MLRKIAVLISMTLMLMSFKAEANYRYSFFFDGSARFDAINFSGFSCAPVNYNYLYCNLGIRNISGATTLEVWGQVPSYTPYPRKVLIARSFNRGNGFYTVAIPNVIRGMWQNFEVYARDSYGRVIVSDRMRFFAPGPRMSVATFNTRYSRVIFY